MDLLRILLILTLISISSAFAGTTDVNCDDLKNVQDVLTCALKSHPDSKIADASLEQGQTLEEVAGQRPNPELNSQAVLGNSPESGQFSYVEFNLAHSFELGGKRGSRIAGAQAELEQRRASALGTREQVYISTLLSLYRVRQLQSELEVLQGALDSFEKIEKQYRARPTLSPEQTASLRIFEVAAGDYQLRLAPLQAALDKELRALELALGKPFIPRPAVLPEQRKTWPKLSESELTQTITGSQVQLSLSNLRYAQAQLDLAQANSWPDLRIGPTFQNQNQGVSSFNAIGLNFTILLPVLNANGAGRAYAYQGLNKAELGLQAVKKEAQDQREYFFRRYQGAVRALETSISPRELDKKHDEVEKLFYRGLLAGSLMIEIHRQILDYTKSQNEQELAAIESLARLYAYQGRLFEEKL